MDASHTGYGQKLVADPAEPWHEVNIPQGYHSRLLGTLLWPGVN